MNVRSTRVRSLAVIVLAAGLLAIAQAPVQARGRPAKGARSAATTESQPKAKRVAVAAFEAPSSSQGRSLVLETLSQHDDVEVVALEDIAMAGKRLQADPSDPSGRRKLSEELGIDAWIDGTIEDETARIRMSTPEGRSLGVANVKGKSSSAVEAALGTQMWKALGPWLSVREQKVRALQAQQELALQKALAREQELVRQHALVQVRAQERVVALQTAQALAREKRAAFDAELARQRGVVEERLALADGERKRLEEAERKRQEAEEAEFQASLQQSQPPSAAPANEAPIVPAGGGVWAASAAPVQPARVEPVASTLAPAGRADGASDPSAATQRWLAQRGAQPAPASAPMYAPVYAPAAAPAGTGAVSMEGVSPATRRWLEQQQQR
jgi:hypothetical protein